MLSFSLSLFLSLSLTKRFDSQRFQASSSHNNNHFLQFSIQNFFPFPSPPLSENLTNTNIAFAPQMTHTASSSFSSLQKGAKKIRDNQIYWFNISHQSFFLTNWFPINIAMTNQIEWWFKIWPQYRNTMKRALSGSHHIDSGYSATNIVLSQMIHDFWMCWMDYIDQMV
jgi:hypothetical protein